MTLNKLLQSGPLAKIESFAYELKLLGFYEFFQKRGRPYIGSNESDAQALATQAARSAGYLDALEDIFNFKERFAPTQTAIPVDPDYGGTNLAKKAGYLDDKDIEILKDM